MSLVKHSLGDGPTRSSSHLSASDHSLIPSYVVAAHMSISHQKRQCISRWLQHAWGARNQAAPYHTICATYISLSLYRSGGDYAAHAAQYASPRRPSIVSGRGGSD